jgi:isopentenyl-diphosphate delta-isomerase
MNMTLQLEEICTFHYRAEFENALIENEIDHIFYGVTDKVPVLNPEEADDWKYLSPAELREDIKLNGANYTAWFKIVINENLLGSLMEG